MSCHGNRLTGAGTGCECPSCEGTVSSSAEFWPDDPLLTADTDFLDWDLAGEKQADGRGLLEEDSRVETLQTHTET